MSRTVSNLRAHTNWIFHIHLQTQILPFLSSRKRYFVVYLFIKENGIYNKAPNPTKIITELPQ